MTIFFSYLQGILMQAAVGPGPMLGQLSHPGAGNLAQLGHPSVGNLGHPSLGNLAQLGHPTLRYPDLLLKVRNNNFFEFYLGGGVGGGGKEYKRSERDIYQWQVILWT